MRLINTRTLELEDFGGTAIPEYAILSHTWQSSELCLNDLRDGIAETKPGFPKLRGAANQALRDGLNYVWLDNCCIDRTNNAELAEAINSMFRWYRNAAVSYAHLSDVESLTDLSQARWWTRSWILQELLGPREIQFFNRDWRRLGSRTELQEAISTITGIPREALTGRDLARYSVAQRMSWASSRVATRPEDVAYSLLGIFDVNMPLIYGEGEKGAFRRLQEEIMKTLEDESIFAWTTPQRYATHGLLAPSPAAFANSGHIVPFRSNRSSSPFTMTNRGLRIDLPLTQCLRTGLRAAALNCVDQRTGARIGIYLRPAGKDCFLRTQLDQLVKFDASRLSRRFRPFQNQVVYVPQERLRLLPGTRRARLWTVDLAGNVRSKAAWPPFRDTGQAFTGDCSKCLQYPANRTLLRNLRNLRYLVTR